jgi:ATP-binding protein involved in chromosome partitioning
MPLPIFSSRCVASQQTDTVWGGEVLTTVIIGHTLQYRDKVPEHLRLVSKDQVMAALKDVMDPELHISIVNLQMVKNIDIESDHVKVLVALTVGGCPLSKTISSDIEKTLTKLQGVKSVNVETTVMTKQELEQLRNKIQSQMAGAQAQRPMPGGAMPPGINRLERKGIRNVIAIMSGKGGVGK